MPDITPTEDQKQLKAILKRWRFLSSALFSVLFFITFGTAGVAVAIYLAKFFGVKRTDIFFISQLCGTIIACAIVMKWIISRHNFVRKLSENDIQLLTNADKLLGQRECKKAAEILNEYRSSGYDKREELLRASTQLQDDTLLRVAAYTDETPQDQLLRPTQNSDPTTQ